MSGPIKFIASDVGTGNHSQLCYSAMFAMKDGISHVWRSHWIRFHRGDGCVRNTKLPMFAVDDTNVYMVSVPGIRFIATWEQGTKRNYATQRCTQRRTAYHMLYNPIGQDSIEGMRCENTRCSFYPTIGQDEVLCRVHSKMRVCPTCWDYRPSYYAVPTGPQNMRRVNTLSGCTIHVKIRILLMYADADVRIYC